MRGNFRLMSTKRRRETESASTHIVLAPQVSPPANQPTASPMSFYGWMACPVIAFRLSSAPDRRLLPRCTSRPLPQSYGIDHSPDCSGRPSWNVLAVFSQYLNSRHVSNLLRVACKCQRCDPIRKPEIYESDTLLLDHLHLVARASTSWL